jgi:predicted transcriptional regulator
MARLGSLYPTVLELDLLKVLWGRSPMSVREVREGLREGAGRRLSHSSVITMLNIMVRKGYLSREKVGRAFHYAPVVDREEVSGGMVGDLVARVFDGSPAELALNLIETAELDAEELGELRRLIQRKAKEQRT